MLKMLMSKKLDRYEFIWKAIQIHGYKYNYRKVDYKNCKEKVCIICPKHGEFWQTPDKHLQGQKCPKCSNKIISEKLCNDIYYFIKKAKEVHGNKYDYSKVEYINNSTKVCIICPKHGEFYQLPSNHLKGYGCYKCCGLKKTNSDFINQAKLVHGDKYDYSKVEYKGANIKVCIICPIHGEFWQTPNSHLNAKAGCPFCNESKLEIEVKEFLDKTKIKYIRQYKPSFLKSKTNSQSLDFYLPDYNIAIECQGRQHFKPVDYFGGKVEFDKIVKRDKRKYNLCIDNGIKLLYYTKAKIINNMNCTTSNFIFNLNKLNLCQEHMEL